MDVHAGQAVIVHAGRVGAVLDARRGRSGVRGHLPAGVFDGHRASRRLMKVLVLSEHDVEHLLTMEACIEVMEDALAALARGEVHNPLRQAIRAPGAPGLLGLMPAWRGGETPYYALKEVCVFPENPKRGLDTHLGAVILHSGETGEPLAFMNASAITAIRTAAVSAVATKLLAREDAAVLAILGTGVQAKSHREAIPLVRPIREIRMCGRGRERGGGRPRRGHHRDRHELARAGPASANG